MRSGTPWMPCASRSKSANSSKRHNDSLLPGNGEKGVYAASLKVNANGSSYGSRCIAFDVTKFNTLSTDVEFTGNQIDGRQRVGKFNHAISNTPFDHQG